jgi:hypothetical protein
MRKKKFFSHATLIIMATFFLIGSFLLLGSFAQEIKKPQERPLSSPVIDTEKDNVVASISFRAPIADTSKKICPGGRKLVVDAVKGPFITIQYAINAASDGDTIEVMPGTYPGFQVLSRRCLKIRAKPKKSQNVIVNGSVTVPTYRGPYKTTIGVVDSTEIEISDFIVTAGITDPLTIAYFNSTGKVEHNSVSGNTGNANPGNGIAAFGIISPGTVEIEHNYIYDYGKIGILVNSWNGYISVPGGIHAEIKHNTIVGTDFADLNRVQDGIQVTYGGSADIEDNNISGNFQTGGSYWTCDGIMAYDAHQVRTKENKIYNNQMGIAIQYYVYDAKFDHDDLEDNEWGLYTWNWVQSTIEVTHAKIKGNEYGWVNWDTNGIVFGHCDLEKNMFGLYASAYSTTNPTAYFNHCNITKNTDTDVMHESNTLIFFKTKYDTYINLGGGILIEN